MTRTHRLLVAGPLALITAVATLTALVKPADAASGDCASGYFCFWLHSSYSGARHNVASGGTRYNLHNWACGSCPNGIWNDRASSWYNRTSRYYCIYWDSGYRGSRILLSPGKAISFNSTWNDQMSSVRPAYWSGGSGTTTTTIPGYYSC